MERKLIYFNAEAYKSDIASLEGHAKQCQAIVDKFKSLSIGEIQKDELRLLIFTTDNYLLDKTMAGKPLEVAGLKLSKQKFYDIIEKPGGYAELITMAEKFIASINWSAGQYKMSNETYVDFFELADVVKLKYTTVQFVKDRNEVYAERETTQLVSEFANNLVELFNKANVFTNVHKMESQHQLQNFITSILSFNYETQKSIVKVEGVKRFDLIR